MLKNLKMCAARKSGMEFNSAVCATPGEFIEDKDK